MTPLLGGMICWGVLLLGAQSVAQGGVAVTDDRGVRIELARPARRVVALAPNITELVFAIGAGERLVGAAAFSDYPAQARQIPRVGDARQLDLERLLALDPDLVLAWVSGNNPGPLRQIESHHVPVYAMEPRRLEDIARELTVLAQLLGQEEKGRAAARAFGAKLATLRREAPKGGAVSVFVQIWPEPLMTVNGRHIISDVVRLCGGVNVFAALEPLAPVVAREQVLALDPEVIVVTRGEGEEAQAESWQRWRSLRAVRRGFVVEVPADDLTRPTPRILLGAEQLCKVTEAARRAR